MERAYIGERHHWVSLGYDGLNGRADFCNQDITSSKRWDKYFLDYIKPQRTYKNGYALVIGQVPGDASHKHININKWYETTIRSLNKKGVPVVFRAHPLARQNNVWQPAADLQFKYDKNPSLEASLKGARCCVTFSSNSGVISMLEGVPTVAYDEGSMVYNIAENDLNNIDNTPDRTDWARKLAYCQWLPAELESGEAWEHLKQGMEEN